MTTVCKILFIGIPANQTSAPCVQSPCTCTLVTRPLCPDIDNRPVLDITFQRKSWNILLDVAAVSSLLALVLGGFLDRTNREADTQKYRSFKRERLQRLRTEYSKSCPQAAVMTTTTAV